MKVIKQYSINETHLLLVRGNLFMDRSVQAYVVNQLLLRRYAKKFGVSYTELDVLGSRYVGFYQTNVEFVEPLRKQFIDWLLTDDHNLLRVAFYPQVIGNAVVLDATKMGALMEPSLVSLGDTMFIVVAEGQQHPVTREDVAEVFSKVLQVSCLANLNRIGTTQFGQPHLSEPIKGMVDAIREFSGNCLPEIRLFEVDPSIERLIFPYIETEMVRATKSD